MWKSRIIIKVQFLLDSEECLVERRSPLHTERTVNNYTCEEGITLMVNGTKYTNGSFNQGKHATLIDSL